MTEDLKRAKGRAKNARNQLQNMLLKKRKDGNVEEESLEYTLDELLAALEHIDEEL